jgi:hypothetical protein
MPIANRAPRAISRPKMTTIPEGRRPPNSAVSITGPAKSTINITFRAGT